MHLVHRRAARVARGEAAGERTAQDQGRLGFALAQALHQGAQSGGRLRAGVLGRVDVVDADLHHDHLRIEDREGAVLRPVEQVLGAIAGEAEGDRAREAVDRPHAACLGHALLVSGQALGDRVAEEDDLEVGVGCGERAHGLELSPPGHAAPARAAAVLDRREGPRRRVVQVDAGLPEQGAHQRPRRVQAVGVVPLPRLAPHRRRGAELGQALDQQLTVGGGGHDLVLRPDQHVHRQLRGGDGFEPVDGGATVIEGARVVQLIGLEQPRPVLVRALAAAAAGPRSGVADRVVEHDRAHAVRVRDREVQHRQPAARHAEQHGFGAEAEAPGEHLVGQLPTAHGLGRAVQVRHVDVDQMEASLEQVEVEVRLMVEEARAPEPGPARGDRIGAHEDAGRAVLGQGEVDPLVAVVVAVLAVDALVDQLVAARAARRAEHAGEAIRDGRGAEGGQVHAVSDVLLAQGAREVDELHLGQAGREAAVGLGELGDTRRAFGQVRRPCLVQAVLAGEHRRRRAEQHAPGAAALFDRLQENEHVSLERGHLVPALALFLQDGVVGPQDDHGHIGAEVPFGGPQRGLDIGPVRPAQHRRATDAQPEHLGPHPEAFLEQPRPVVFADQPRASGDRVSEADDALPEGEGGRQEEQQKTHGHTGTDAGIDRLVQNA